MQGLVAPLSSALVSPDVRTYAELVEENTTNENEEEVSRRNRASAGFGMLGRTDRVQKSGHLGCGPVLRNWLQFLERAGKGIRICIALA